MFWQLRNPIAVKPSRTLAERIRELGKPADFADELDEPVDSISDALPHCPADHLHIYVALPAPSEWSSLLLRMRSADLPLYNFINDTQPSKT